MKITFFLAVAFILVCFYPHTRQAMSQTTVAEIEKMVQDNYAKLSSKDFNERFKAVFFSKPSQGDSSMIKS